MVFFALLCRASTSVTPLTFPTVRSGKIWSRVTGQYVYKVGSIPIFQQCRLSPTLHLCTASTVKTSKTMKKQSLETADECHNNLVKILTTEIKWALESDLIDIAVDIPNPFPFKIEDYDGGRSVVLTREFEDETVKIEVDMPNTGVIRRDNCFDGGEIEPTIPIVVTVSKASELVSLIIHATAWPDRISVDGLSLNNSANSQDCYAYKGPFQFSHMKENLRNEIHDYLEIRGLTSSTAKFLLEYMICKDAKEYLRWLRILKKNFTVHQ